MVKLCSSCSINMVENFVIRHWPYNTMLLGQCVHTKGMIILSYKSLLIKLWPLSLTVTSEHKNKLRWLSASFNIWSWPLNYELDLQLQTSQCQGSPPCQNKEVQRQIVLINTQTGGSYQPDCLPALHSYMLDKKSDTSHIGSRWPIHLYMLYILI